MQIFVAGSYDADKKTLHIPADWLAVKRDFGFLNMIGRDILITLRSAAEDMTADDMIMLPGFGILIAKVERVNASEDGVSLKLTTEGIKTKGKYATKKVKESLDGVKSGDYHVSMSALNDMFIPVLRSWPGADFNSLSVGVEVEVEVEGNNIKMVPNEERMLKYNKKEERVDSVATSKVMEEIRKNLEEDKDGKNVKLVMRTKEGDELMCALQGLERGSGVYMWFGKINGSNNTLKYVKSANIEDALLLVTPLLLG